MNVDWAPKNDDDDDVVVVGSRVGAVDVGSRCQM